jgi:hypothetical protein
VMSRWCVVEEVHIEDSDSQYGEQLRPEHPLLKGKAGHKFSMSKIFDMGNFRVNQYECQIFWT